MSFGGIEAGGTRWTCAIAGDGPDLARVESSSTPAPERSPARATALTRVESFPTTTPAETLARAVAFFAAEPDLQALGIGAFGPVEVDPGSPRFGTITTTPKPGWRDTDVVGPLAAALGVPIALDTDVNAAAVGEWRHGAARGLDTFVYLTVGTGIGGGVFAGGRPLHGLLHPELGHMRVPHDRARDPFEGSCPFHGDCLEGLASGTAVRARWGRPGEELTDPSAWDLVAEYLALGLTNVVLTLSAERIVLGGGVGEASGLLPRIRTRLQELLAGYIDVPQLRDGIDDYLVPPALGKRSGVLGAITLARTAAVSHGRGPR